MKALPDHGTLYRRKAYTCRCEPCLTAEREWARTRSRLIAYGRWQPLIDATPTRNHIRALMGAGVGLATIRKLAGIGGGTLTKIVYGVRGEGKPPTRRVRPATAAAILAIQPTLDNLAAGARIDATGTRRRIQALVAAGWPQYAMAAATGIDHQWFSLILNTQRAVEVGRARHVRDVYERLRHLPPESYGASSYWVGRARDQARANSWPDPTWWEDYGHLDDPDFNPRTAETRDKGRAWLTVEVKHLAACGVSAHEIAARLDRTEAYVRQILAGHRSPGQRRQYEEAA
jgi:hypothetical protein